MNLLFDTLGWMCSDTSQFPTSLLVKRLQFNRVIPIITFCWGIVCLCTGFVRSFPALIVTRILLGFFEGCLFPSMTLFLCQWYMREELGKRIAFLFSKFSITHRLLLFFKVGHFSRIGLVRRFWRSASMGNIVHGRRRRNAWLAMVTLSQLSIIKPLF